MDKKFYFGTYVPKAYRELATEQERSFSDWVINFKDGQKAQLKEGAQMVIGKLHEWYGDKASELVVVPVPASSMSQYRYRFAYFCVVVANTLGQLNPMQHVTILGRRQPFHRNPEHTAQEDGYEVRIDTDFFKGKKVVIVDDIISSGKTADRFSDLLTGAGADVKGGIFFAKTKISFGEQAEPQPEPSPEPLPTGFALHAMQTAERYEKTKEDAKTKAAGRMKAATKAKTRRTRKAGKEVQA